MNPALAMSGYSSRDKKKIIQRERKLRRLGQWGEWEHVPLLPGQLSARPGWLSQMHMAHRNKVFCALQRAAPGDVMHFAITSLSQDRPTWHEMQRIKDELAGRELTGVEVYPPHEEIVDEADMYHLWVLPHPYPFGLNGEESHD